MKKIIVAMSLVVLSIGCFTSPSNENKSMEEQENQFTSNDKINQVPYGYYCCDHGGYRRCVLNIPAPVGSMCYCFGQGSGYTCF